ncbi:hypothetical protein NP493_2794g00004 [Ridgeia piscesae]|uniref:Uncharacterized protein n=1 Tax=Ridgeia piscesae TaxID=27915 RepID=A0AAD9JD04_RIDPI|nr:hypothetical protein NP493_2794g00004 [Ridgeia piscesae]
MASCSHSQPSFSTRNQFSSKYGGLNLGSSSYKCAEVKKGDRLGVYTVVSPGSIAYNFESQQPSTKSYAYDGQNDYIPDGTVVSFDSLVYPYKFSAAAFIDTGEFHVLTPR